MKWIVLLSFISSVSWASEVILDRTNHIGVRQMDVLKKEKGEYIFDGKSLGKTLPPKTLKIWNEISKGPAKNLKVKNCAAGTMTYTLKNKKEKHFTACTEGPGYAELVQKLDELREFAKGIK